ncbi:serine/threonine-protein kinase [Nocardia aurantiaca]|uniref:non-specific serine/threonine protein kinase n=1 Tax=Nocardia aurantiaca TaxID=2675850 RepID=A0A6I3L757_9NOCA|nr:serine/threonine-protein kinase [Nocardia aurantiaca]MTE17351.1 protein kinase [Nocardia aurantiaca]
MSVEGTRFGRYVLQQLLGEGGMGQVYRAFDTGTDRVVAVKVLHAHIAADPVFRERFRREAKTAAALGDPHVVPIFDYGQIEGHLFMCMQFLDGEGVDALLARSGPMAVTDAVSVLTQAAAALQAAHAAGLVHRDVKPSNLFITANGFVYLIDFGIARAAGETGLTSIGSTIGTFAYMAPERFTTGIADARADVYALACVAFELLTGRPPFPAAGVEQHIAAHLTQPPPRPSLLRPEVGTGFDAVIARGLAKDPDQRYQTAGELAAACLASASAAPRLVATQVNPGPRLADPQPVHSVELARAAPIPVPPSPSSSYRVVLPALGIAAVTVLAIGYWVLKDTSPHSQPLTASPTLIAVPAGGVLGIAVDPGTHTAYITKGDNTVSVIDTTTHAVTATIPVGKNPMGVAVDPDTHTAYVTSYSDNTVSVIDTTTRAVTATIPVGKNPMGVAMDPGTHNAYVTNYGDGDNTVSVIDTTTHAVTATIPVGKDPEGVAVDPGTHTAYTTNNSDATVSVIDTATRAVTATIPVGKDPEGVAVDPGTHTAYLTYHNDATVSVIDTTTRAVTATIRAGVFPMGVAVDPGTHTAYVTNDDDTVSVIDTATRAVTATIPVGKHPHGVAVDPGTHTVYVTNTDNTVSVIPRA